MTEPDAREPDLSRLRADAVGGPLAAQSRGYRLFLAGLGVFALLVALLLVGLVIWLPVSVALGATTVSAGTGAVIAFFVTLPLCAAAAVWMFWTYTVRNLRDLRTTDAAIGRDGAMPPLRPAKPGSRRLAVVIVIAAFVLAFGIPALALLDR